MLLGERESAVGTPTMNVLRLLFSFAGRATRRQYWLVTLGWWGVLLVMLALFISLGMRGSGFGYAHLAIAFIFAIPWFVSSNAIAVRRLHDLNLSGLWVLAFYALVLVLGGIEDALGRTQLVHVLGRLLPVASTLILGIVPSQPAPRSEMVRTTKREV
jgi:uncharacterized membrane protein YhaH (DUF805 family)